MKQRPLGVQAGRNWMKSGLHARLRLVPSDRSGPVAGLLRAFETNRRLDGN